MRIFHPVRWIAAALTLALSVSACSGGLDEGLPTADAGSTVAATTSAVDLPAPATVGGAPTTDGKDVAASDSGRPFGADRDILAQALQTATAAAGYEIDENIIRLTYTEGSVDDVAAMTNCRVAGQLMAEDDRVVLVYPDGELDCADDTTAGGAADGADQSEAASGSAAVDENSATAGETAVPEGLATEADGAAAAAGTSGAATVTLGDRTWDIPVAACAFGEEEIGVAGSEFNMLATGDGLMLYAAIDDGYTYIEFAATGQDSGDAIELITYPEPTITIDGKAISGHGTFVGNGDAGPGEPIEGSMSATCP